MSTASQKEQGEKSAPEQQMLAITSERAEALTAQVAPGRAAQRIVMSRGLRSEDVLALQRSIGNQAVQRLLARRANRFGQCDANGVGADADAAVDRAASSTGQPLPGNVRNHFERSLDLDLSNVSVHTGGESAEAAEAVGAKAYTVGQDIHFGVGQYAPADPAGVHLLAHEVVHTVQNRGGAPAPTGKLEVSTPADSAEVEADRAADAIVSGGSVNVSVVPAAIHRDADPPASQTAPQPQPTPDPAPTVPSATSTPGSGAQTPFDDTKLPANAIAAIDSVAIDTLRAMAMVAVEHAYGNYRDACGEVITTLGLEKVKREEGEKEIVNIAIGAAGLILGPVGVAIGAKVAGPALQAGLVAKVEEKLPAILAKEGTDMQTRQALTQAVISKISNDRVTELLAKFTPDKATALVGKAAAAAAGVMAKVNVRGSSEEKASSYVEALRNKADAHSSALQTALGTCTDSSALIGVHNQFAAATRELYKTDINTKAHNFMTQVATTLGPQNRGWIVSINAYGQERLANVHYNTDSANFIFYSWVTPDMEPMVRASNPNPYRITPEMVVGHLPDPTIEGAVSGQEQIFKVDAWGKTRLVVVKADKGFFYTNYGEILFVRWVPADEEDAANVKGSAQIGGIRQIDASKIKGLREPKDNT